MTTLKPGDVVTDEPGPGAVIEVAGRRFLSCDQREGYEAARWCGQDGDDYEWCCWDDLRSLGPVRLLLPGVTDKCSSPVDTSTPAPAGDAAAELEALASWLNSSRNCTSDPDVRHGLQIARAEAARRAAHLRAAAPAPAELETITAADVQVGDHIEVTREWGHGRMVAVFVVGSRTDAMAYSVDRNHGTALRADFGDTVTIRRRVRQQMREPEAPAVVRHGGQVWVRQEMQDDGERGGGTNWWPLSLGGGNRASEWRTWREVLALDPATDPVVVDLGGGA